MPNPFDVLLHHSEPIDPTLWEWIEDEIHDVLGIDSAVAVLILGLLMIAFPLAVLVLAVRKQRRSK
jgi:hypothetical protein